MCWYNHTAHSAPVALVLASSDLQAINKDGVLAGTRMILVLDTDGELEFETREFPDLAPVTTVEQHLVLEVLAGDVLVEDLGHLLGSVVVQGVGLGRLVEGADDSARWGTAIVVKVG